MNPQTPPCPTCQGHLEVAQSKSETNFGKPYYSCGQCKANGGNLWKGWTLNPDGSQARPIHTEQKKDNANNSNNDAWRSSVEARLLSIERHVGLTSGYQPAPQPAPQPVAQQPPQQQSQYVVQQPPQPVAQQSPYAHYNPPHVAHQ